MNKTSLVYYSQKKENLNGLLSAIEKCNEAPVQSIGFQDKNIFLDFIQKKTSDKKNGIIILDINDSDNKTFEFLKDVSRSSPDTLKLIFSDNVHLLNIQNEFKSADLFQYLSRCWSETDYRVVLNSKHYYFKNRQTFNNNKFEVSGLSKEPEDQVLAQLKELKESNMAKDKFFSIIAHDLKSPFTALIGITEILLSDWEEISDKEKLDLVKALKSSSESTYNLLENLLIWSRSQMGKIEAVPETIKVNKIITAAIEISLSGVDQKQIHIENNTPKELEIYADKNMISTIFRNLLSNAVKYIRSAGEIEITATVDNNICTFCVADNGDGISQQHILDYFKSDHTNNNITTNFKGLGLLLCKNFVECNGGQIWLETENDKGSKFFFTTPC